MFPRGINEIAFPRSCKTLYYDIHGDKNGNYTFSSQRGLSVTDYLLLNKNDIISLHDFKILKWSPVSDHAAVYFTFNMQCINDENSKSNRLSDQRLIFNEEKVPEFKELLKNTIHSISNKNISDTMRSYK